MHFGHMFGNFKAVLDFQISKDTVLECMHTVYISNGTWHFCQFFIQPLVTRFI